MSEIKRSGEFLESSDVEKAKETHETPHSNPLAQKLSAEANQAITEIEDIFWAGSTYDSRKGVFQAKNITDETIAFIKSLGDSEEVKAQIDATKQGGVLILKNRAYVKTAIKTFEDAESYIFRLEKALIATRKKLHPFGDYSEDKKLESLQKPSVWQELKTWLLNTFGG